MEPNELQDSFNLANIVQKFNFIRDYYFHIDIKNKSKEGISMSSHMIYSEPYPENCIIEEELERRMKINGGSDFFILILNEGGKYFPITVNNLIDEKQTIIKYRQDKLTLIILFQPDDVEMVEKLYITLKEFKTKCDNLNIIFIQDISENQPLIQASIFSDEANYKVNWKSYQGRMLYTRPAYKRIGLLLIDNNNRVLFNRDYTTFNFDKCIDCLSKLLSLNDGKSSSTNLLNDLPLNWISLHNFTRWENINNKKKIDEYSDYTRRIDYYKFNENDKMTHDCSYFYFE